MANIRNGNTYYIDSTGAVTTGPNDKVTAVVLAGTSGNATLSLADNNAGASYPAKLTIVTPNNSTIHIKDIAILFPSGVYVSAISGGVATLIVNQGSG